jgi:hypothetical protein
MKMTVRYFFGENWSGKTVEADSFGFERARIYICDMSGSNITDVKWVLDLEDKKVRFYHIDGTQLGIGTLQED